MTEALEILAYSIRDASPETRAKKAVCPVCGRKYPWRPRGVGWGIYGGPNTCSYKCQREAEKQMEEAQEPKKERAGFVRKSAFDGHLEEITERLRAGEQKAMIARSYGRGSASLIGWLKQHLSAEEMGALNKENRQAKKEEPRMEKAEKAECAVKIKTESAGAERVWEIAQACGVLRGLCHTNLIEDYWPVADEALDTIIKAVKEALA